MQAADEAKLAEDLNMLYTRSDKRDFHMEQEQAPKQLKSEKQWKMRWKAKPFICLWLS